MRFLIVAARTHVGPAKRRAGAGESGLVPAAMSFRASSPRRRIRAHLSACGRVRCAVFRNCVWCLFTAMSLIKFRDRAIGLFPNRGGSSGGFFSIFQKRLGFAATWYKFGYLCKKLDLCLSSCFAFASLESKIGRAGGKGRVRPDFQAGNFARQPWRAACCEQVVRREVSGRVSMAFFAAR